MKRISQFAYSNGLLDTVKINPVKRTKVITAKLVMVSTLVLTFSGCAVVVENGESQWDFDHQIQFKQTKLDNGHYKLQVIPQNKTRFNKLATFLLRQSKDICGSYGYSIKIIGGVQGFHEAEGAPNKIMSSLTAEVNCQPS